MCNIDKIADGCATFHNFKSLNFKHQCIIITIIIIFSVYFVLDMSVELSKNIFLYNKWMEMWRISKT